MALVYIPNSERFAVMCDADAGAVDAAFLKTLDPNAIGLRYSATDGAQRFLLTDANGQIFPPEGGWAIARYHCVLEKRINANLLIYGFNPTTSRARLQAVFEQIGPVSSVKTKRRFGGKQTYGYVQFLNFADTKRALAQRFFAIDGHRVELKIPTNIARKQFTDANKIIVRQWPNSRSTEEMWAFFGQFGVVIDVYIPRSDLKLTYGFVTFLEQHVAEVLSGGVYTLPESQISVERVRLAGG